MNVRQLIQALEGMDPNASVRFAHSQGNYQAIMSYEPSYVDSGKVRWSEDDRADVVINDEDDEDDGEDVVILWSVAPR